MHRTKILIVAGNKADSETYRRYLQQFEAHSYDIAQVETGEEAESAAASSAPDCMVLHDRLPDTDGLELMEDLSASGALPPVVMITGPGSDPVAVRAMKVGAFDDLPRSELTAQALVRAIENVVNKADLLATIEYMRAEHRSFTRAAAHDLRAPLRRVAMLAGMVRSDLAAGEVSSLDPPLAVMETQARRMTQLLNDLLEFAQSDQIIGSDATNVDLNAVTEAVTERLSANIAACGAQVHVSPLPKVRGLARPLSVTLHHLIANAIKFHDGSAPRVSVHSSEGRDTWTISVQDDGIGIEPRYHDAVFEPFRRLHATRTFSGSGVGLATCRRAIERHGGRIWLESALGRGTTVHFSLPKRGPPTAATMRTATPRPRSG
ncbi:MAG: ATP-binding protein [Nannocystaceae bacterium]